MLRKPPPGAILNQNHPLARGVILAALLNDNDGMYADYSILRQPQQRSNATTAVPVFPAWGNGLFGSIGVNFNQAQAAAAEIVFQRQGPNRLANINVAHSIMVVFRLSAITTGKETMVSVGQRTDTNSSLGLCLDNAANKLSNINAVSTGAALTAGTVYVAGYSQTSATARSFWQNGIRTTNTTNVGSGTIGSDQPISIGVGFVNGAENANSRMQGLIDYVLMWSRGITDMEAIDFTRNPFSMFTLPVTRRHKTFSIPSGTTYNVSASDFATATDLAARALAATRAASDAAAATDAAARAGSIWVRSSSDTLTVSDLAAGGRLITRSASDSAAATDATSGAKVSARAASDTESATDAASASKVSVRTAADSASIGDAAGRSVTFSRAASDSLVVGDVAERAGSIWNRAASDSVSATDATSGVKGAVVNAGDTIATGDTASRAGSVWVRNASDTLGIADAATSLRFTHAAAQDVVSIAEAAGRLVTFRRSAVDTDAATDTASATVAHGGGSNLLLLRRRYRRMAA